MWSWEAENAKAVMIMVHGAMEYHGRYGALGDLWTHNGFHVVMGDLPGHGMASRKRGHIDQFDEYIEEVKLWVKEAQRYQLPIFLFGHSMGGLVVIRLLQETRMNVQGVILSSPCLGVQSAPSAPLRALSKVLNIVAPKMQFTSPLTVEMATNNREIQDSMENDSLYLRKVSVRWYSELVKAVKIAHEKIDEFPDVPILLMQACEDQIVDKLSVRKWFDGLQISDKHYKEWDHCYHELFSEDDREQIFSYAKYFAKVHLIKECEKK
ncbi:alpha/beta hydrolase [Microbacteriaceae bacterium 4G12]